jgi:hypothetical protein
MVNDPILPDAPVQPKMEVGVKQQQEYKHIGSLKLRRGMILYSFIPDTGELKEVEVTRKVLVDTKGKPIKKINAPFNPKAYYIQAINWKNARRKADKIIFQLRVINEGLRRHKAQKGQR